MTRARNTRFQEISQHRRLRRIKERMPAERKELREAKNCVLIAVSRDLAEDIWIEYGPSWLTACLLELTRRLQDELRKGSRS